MHHSSVPSTFAIFFRLSEYFKKIQFFWLFFWRNYFFGKILMYTEISKSIIEIFCGNHGETLMEQFPIFKTWFFQFWSIRNTPNTKILRKKRKFSKKSTSSHCFQSKKSPIFQQLQYLECCFWHENNSFEPIDHQNQFGTTNSNDFLRLVFEKKNRKNSQNSGNTEKVWN